MKLLVLVCLYLSFASSFPVNTLINLRETALDCTKNNEIELRFAATELQLDTRVSFSSRLYNGMLPGPLIIMKAGTVCSLTLYNDMQTEPCVSEQANGYHCPDSTVLHMHGLHVSPNDDNIVDVIPAGSKRKYTYNLQDNLMMGTFWYHSHQHGAVSLQVNGGAYGMLLVEASAKFQLPSDLSILYDNHENNYLIVFSVVDFRDPYANFGETDVHNYLAIVNSYSPNSVPPPSPVNPPYDYYVAVNGQYAPTINATAGKTFLIRSSFTSGTDLLCLQFTSPKKCQMRILARDGVFHSKEVKYNDVETIVFFQGTRTDVAILCSEPGDYILGTVTTTDGLSDYQQSEVLHIKVGEATEKIPLPTSYIPNSEFPDYLQDLTSEYRSIPVSQVIGFHGALIMNSFTDTTPSSNFGIQTSEDQNPPYYFWEGFNNIKFINNNKKGEGWCVNDVYKIRLYGDHPFHHHINHYQVLDTSLDDPEMLRNKEWRDVVISTHEASELLVKYADYDGYYVLHCHIFEHADFGMTSALNISHCNYDENSLESSSTSSSTLNNLLFTFTIIFISVYFNY